MTRTKLNDRVLPPYTKGEEIFNMTSHIVGGALSIAAIVLCVVIAAQHRNVYGVVSGAIYGASLLILYTMSSLYHGLSKALMAKRVFQIIDHCSVFFLIAGTYTPIALSALRRINTPLGWVIFGVIWGMAAVGICLNAIDLKTFSLFSMICYIVMGWCIVAAAKPTYEAIGKGGVIFLVLGGIAYTIGAVLYAIGKKYNIKYIHSVFHLFVLAGSILHFFCIIFYVI